MVREQLGQHLSRASLIRPLWRPGYSSAAGGSGIIERMDEAKPPIRVLIVDNEQDHAQAVAESLERVGYVCTVANSGQQGVDLLGREAFDVIITDLIMNDIDGLGVLAAAKEAMPDIEVILLTGHGTIESAVEAMQQGAFNYLLKPLNIQQLRAVTEKACENLELRRSNAELTRRLDERFGFEGIIGTSSRMRHLVEMLKRVSPTDARVLITGETGTGKELAAKAIHQNSPRKKKPFLPLNCASFVENILDVELFGSLPGVYTDARDRAGKFEHANGGTLFLDEIGDMPLATQAKLLRVLESNEITRMGANEPIKVNVRVLSATNRNLRDLVREGKFREDLFHRISVITVEMPNLRDRAQDLPLLIDHFIKEFSKRHHKQVTSMSTEARRAFFDYAWPGNVRELSNAIESMVVVDADGVLDLDDLPPTLAGDDGAREEKPAEPAQLRDFVGRPLEELERMFLAETLDFTGGNREEAARMLGIGERTLYRKIGKFNL